ncbi:MAG: hypothetical protein ABSG78_07485 [Verrucomicrobiota bacterium]
MRTNTGFENEQLELSSPDAHLPRLALQAANELNALIERHKSTSESARRLAAVWKKSFRPQPVSVAAGGVAASGAAAVYSQGRDEAAPGGEVSILARLQTARAAILNRLVPMGYEDDTGFHCGKPDDGGGDGRWRLLQPGGAIVARERSQAGGQSA